MWRLRPGQRLRSRSWNGEDFVLYNNLSGDTHLLDAASIEILSVLQRGPATTAGLAAALQIADGVPAEPDQLAELEELLGQLRAMALVDTPAASAC
ncbi:HPr-rel-A system PqqD family peptide chaperone [Pseudoduganella aquatica]|uniref:HPr-rel-A system PqqD family peptide chaperone n=1 Tax=Pseudoduganella aquatica TaxID=2660641 RepID=A0A7X4HJB5_9BURK|nr:HPr-rel-A system PqqD family peptide chaperone [Pseudoduganella aquatica]MYN11225.1 HPr-rel-A system PqqD family peptide chaperone [Pseudoduganella aquatica]